MRARLVRRELAGLFVCGLKHRTEKWEPVSDPVPKGYGKPRVGMIAILTNINRIWQPFTEYPIHY